MFVLVRHARAVKKQKWSGADLERPLNRRGLRQSQGLVSLLSEIGVAHLICSPTERCRATLAPASEQLSSPIAYNEALAVGAPVADLLDLLESAGIENTALCTHGEVFVALTRAWATTWPGLSAKPDLTGTPKGAAWIIENYGTADAAARSVSAPET